ncbi:MAG: hypothetical protein E7471_04165 [Ruminococcaceae bacterium]|nr:hypothetical protein [Oscillospiraceae bacterium]
MNATWNELQQKIREKALLAGEMAAKGASVASQKAADVWNNSKKSVKVFELNTQIDMLYREIGRMAYQAHIGADVDEDLIETAFASVDEKLAQIAQLKAEEE